jgi:hypothetical protein
MDGRSLLPVLDGASNGRDAAYTSRHPFLQRRANPVTISTAEWSYIYWPGNNGERSELYHLPSDPRQERNVIGEQRALADELRRDYLGWLRERAAEMADWVESVERDADWQPDADRAWKGPI